MLLFPNFLGAIFLRARLAKITDAMQRHFLLIHSLHSPGWSLFFCTLFSYLFFPRVAFVVRELILPIYPFFSILGYSFGSFAIEHFWNSWLQYLCTNRYLFPKLLGKKVDEIYRNSICFVFFLYGVSLYGWRGWCWRSNRISKLAIRNPCHVLLEILKIKRVEICVCSCLAVPYIDEQRWVFLDGLVMNTPSIKNLYKIKITLHECAYSGTRKQIIVLIVQSIYFRF